MGMRGKTVLRSRWPALCPPKSAGRRANSSEIVQRQHRATKRLLQSLDQLLLGFGADIETAVLLGEAFGIENALLSYPAYSLQAIADDVDRKIGRGRMQFFAEIARRAPARLLTVGDHHDDTWLMAIVENLG